MQPLEGVSLAPYREGPLPRVAASRRLRYWPCFGLWPLLVTLAFAIPLALAVSPSTPVVGKHISVTRTETSAVEPPREERPEALPAVIPALRCVAFLRPDEMGAGSSRDGHVDASSTPLPAPRVTQSDAGAGTVSLLVTERGHLLSALLLIAALSLAIALMFRRRVRIDVDGGACVLHVSERGWFRLRRSLTVPAPLIREVVVARRCDGIARGRRVELVGFDGSRVPLAGAYSVLTWRVHQRMAARLVEALWAPRMAGSGGGIVTPT